MTMVLMMFDVNMIVLTQDNVSLSSVEAFCVDHNHLVYGRMQQVCISVISVTCTGHLVYGRMQQFSSSPNTRTMLNAEYSPVSVVTRGL